jgi:hypothetical protein
MVDYDSFKQVSPFVYYFNDFHFIYFLVSNMYMKNYH